MLTGAERSKTLWALNDQLAAFSRKLHLLYLSLRYYTLERRVEQHNGGYDRPQQRRSTRLVCPAGAGRQPPPVEKRTIKRKNDEADNLDMDSVAVRRYLEGTGAERCDPCGNDSGLYQQRPRRN